MKKRFFAMAALLGASAPVAHAQFTAGDLVVLRDGTGSAALSSAGTAIFLDEFSTGGGSPVSSLNLTTATGTSFVNSGTATSEGQLTLSPDGSLIMVAGYEAATGTAGVATATSTSVPRAFGSVDASGNFTIIDTTGSVFSANNIRSAATDGNGNYWASGATGVYNVTSSSQTQITTTPGNTRVIQDIGGNLWISTGSTAPSGAASHGIYELTGLPTTSGNTATLALSAGSSSSPYDFAVGNQVISSVSTPVAYVADSDNYTTASGVGGVEKWTFNGTSWVFQYSLPSPLGTGNGGGAEGLAVDFSGADPVIYGTTAGASGVQTELFSITDTGSGATATDLETAPANEAFRGLVFAPVSSVPEPSVLTLLGCGLPALLWRLRRVVKS